MPRKTSRILVIDDEAPICELLQESLSKKDVICDAVSSAKTALEVLNRQVYDLALIDIRLPDISGLDLLRQIRSLYPSISTIMLTAVNDLAVAVESMKAGAQDYITKPFDLDRLDQVIQAILNAKEVPQSIENPELILNEIEAIARGVEARQDMLDVHSEKVIQKTIVVARQMGFSQDKIQQWVAAKGEEKSKKIKQVTNSLFNMG